MPKVIEITLRVANVAEFQTALKQWRRTRPRLAVVVVNRIRAALARLRI